MILSHGGKEPRIDPAAYIAPNATVCGDVSIAAGCRVLFGACIVSEGQPLALGENCIVMENAVIRSTDEHATTIGPDCLVGPHAHLVGCTLEDSVFIATGASVLHGAYLEFGAEVRVHATVHLRTRLPRHQTVPIGWVAAGNPASVLPPGEHAAIWAIQRPLDFPKFVYGVERAPEGGTNMPEIAARRSLALAAHLEDRPALGHSQPGPPQPAAAFPPDGSSGTPMPALNDVKETSLYVDDLERAKQFYKGVLGLRALVEDDRLCALDVAGRHILLLFRRGASLSESRLPGGTIPPHDGAGPLHVAFAVAGKELPRWEAYLRSSGVEILSRVAWPRGGKSIYFRDPDGHLLELLTPGVWATY